MIRRFWNWLKSLFVDDHPAVRPFTDDQRKDYRRLHAQSANICLARRSSMKHERMNARRTLRALDFLEAKHII